MDQLVSEDHTKTTSILHWIQVDIIFEFFFVKILFLQFLEWEANIFVSFLKTTLWWWHGCRYLYVMLLKGSLMYLIFTGFVNSHVSNYRDDLRKNKKILFQRFSIFYLYSIKIGSNGKLNRRQGRLRGSLADILTTRCSTQGNIQQMAPCAPRHGQGPFLRLSLSGLTDVTQTQSQNLPLEI